MRSKISFFLSGSLHVMLLLYFVIAFHWDDPTVGNVHVIHAYLYQNNLITRSSQAIEISPRKLSKRGNLAHSNQSHSTLQNKHFTCQSQKTKGEPQRLLEILHNKIQSNIEYQNSFFYDVRRVTIGFMLFQDGHLESIQILQSSGDDRFDQMVLDSVQLIQPVVEAKKYLKDKNYFKLNILFNPDIS